MMLFTIQMAFEKYMMHSDCTATVKSAPMENKHPMNIGIHFDYNNHITFISTHTKIGTPHEKTPDNHAKGSEFADSAFSNVQLIFASIYLQL